jgi:hypothetical protein
MKNLTKKIGVGLFSAFLLGSCATQKYSAKPVEGSLLDKSEYALTSDILKDENKKLNELESKFNRALENGATILSPEFLNLLQDYEYQRSRVENYQDILRMGSKKK